jgi:hypothetical protein
VHARSAAVRIFKGLHRAKGRLDFVRALLRTGAGDGYDKDNSSIITNSDSPRFLELIYVRKPHSSA